MCFFEEKDGSSLSIWGNFLTLQTAHGNFLIFYQMVLLSNIYFLRSKQSKTPKTDPKNVQAVGWSYCPILVFYKNRALQPNINKQVNKYLYYNELQLLFACFRSDSNDILNSLSYLARTWFQYLYLYIYNQKGTLNCI